MKEKEKSNKREEDHFELCEVCRLNHDQGRRHKYSSSHVRSLTSLLSRFHKKIGGLRSLLKNPSMASPGHSHPDRLWCVFCGVDVLEIGSTFACSNTIYHLASAEHLKNLKDFLRKHGGGMDRIDSFRVSDADLIKWEKGCKSLKSSTSTYSEGATGPLPGPSKDIQNEFTSKNIDSFDNHSISYINLNDYHNVMPLQSLTNEDYRVCPQGRHVGTGSGLATHAATSFSGGLPESMGLQDVRATEGVSILPGTQSIRLGNGKPLAGHALNNGMGNRFGSVVTCTKVLQSSTQTTLAAKGFQANVHTGALPPWLDAIEEEQLNQPNTAPYVNTPTISSSQKGKSRKLNPKRVGAAWAEKRRVELEMENRGERVPSTIDANWLPNFGRVWQTGTRKESRKEFEVEKQKFLKDETQPEPSFKLQPYMSKRMRTGSPSKEGVVSSYAELS